MSRKHLVTGVAGMIGSHLARRLVQQGEDVAGVDNLLAGTLKNVRDIKDDFEMVIGDCRDLATCLRLSKGKDYIWTFAANMGGIQFITRKFADVIRDNTTININMLEACNLMDVGRMFYSSSACFTPNMEVITNPSFKCISDIKVGDRVMADDGEYYPVKYVGTRPYDGEILNFKTYGINIDCTPEHPIGVDDNGQIVWKRAKDLKKGDYIVIPRPYNREGEYPLVLQFLPERYRVQNELAKYLKQLGYKVGWAEAKQIAHNYGLARTLVYNYSRGYEVKKGNRICKFQPRFRNLPAYVDVDSDFMELLGIFIAEGWIEKRAVSFAFGGGDKEYAKRCEQLMGDIFNLKGHYRSFKNQRGFKIEYHSQFLIQLFRKLAYGDADGHRARNKVLPNWIFDVPVKMKEAFIKGYWLGDGTYSYVASKRHEPIISCSTVSQTLHWQLRTLLLQLGIFNSIYKAKRVTSIQGRRVKCTTPYQLYIREYDSKMRLLSILGKTPEPNASTRHAKNIKYRDKYFAIPLKQIISKVYKGLVWNLEVEGNHTYTIQNVAVHNCVYSELYQRVTDIEPLKEEYAYPAMPNEAYGWEKLYNEQACDAYMKDYNLNIRIARFHNVFGGAMNAFDKERGKAPAHMIIKAKQHPNPPFVIWGDGRQTRSFLYIDDCIDGILRLMDSDYNKPINIGSDRLINMTDLAKIAMKHAGKNPEFIYDLSKPQGVRGRNSDNTLVRQVLNWEPTVSLEEGMKRMYEFAIEHYDELEGI